MTELQWGYRSDEWRKGWRYGQGDIFESANFDSNDFCDGYKHALEHPIGGGYTVDATTGPKMEEWRNSNGMRKLRFA